MRSEKHEEATRCSLRLCSRDAAPLRALAPPSRSHARSSAAPRLTGACGPLGARFVNEGFGSLSWGNGVPQGGCR
jgi:hypothetical protein